MSRRYVSILSLLFLLNCGGGNPPTPTPIPPAPTPAPAIPALWPVPTPTANPTPLAGVAGDGVTDDAAVIQAALNQHGTIYLPATAAFYRTSVPLLITSNTELLIDGMIKLDGGYNPGVTPPEPGWPYGLSYQTGVLQIVDGSHDIVVEGKGIIDGNRALQTHCCIGGITAGGPNIADYGANISNVTVAGSPGNTLTIQNTFQWPISFDGTNGALMNHLKITNGGNTVQFAHGSNNVQAAYLDVSNIDDIGVGFYNMVTNGSILYSTVTVTKGTAFSLLTDNVVPADAVTTGFSSNLTFAGNTAYNSYGGLDTNTERNNLVQYFTNINFINNISHNNTIEGYGVAGCLGCGFYGNVSHDDGVATQYVSGLVIRPMVSNLTVSGNTFTDEGPGTVTGRGVSITPSGPDDPNINGIVITGNTITDNVPKTMDGALCIGNGLATQPTWTNNTVVGINPVTGCVH